MRPRLHPEHGAQAGHRDGAVERVRLRWHQRHARFSQVPGLSSSLPAEPVTALERALGHRFADPALLTRAITHASYANEHPPLAAQDGLAFLGDAALGLVVAERLLVREPDAAVGVLTPARAALVSGVNLARWAEGLGLGGLLRLGRGEEQTGGRGRESILATTLEAVLGVIYMEAGLAGVRRAVDTLASDTP